MDFEELLRGRACECGMTHTCAIRHVVIGEGANRRLAPLLAEYRSVVLVADTHTYAVCGETIRDQIGEKLEATKVYARAGLLIPNEEACAELHACLTERTDLIVGVGSGVIQDICKYVSWQAKLPYAIVATAPSMDGYASASAAMIWNGMKVTYPAHVPVAILGDIDVLKDAPMDMIRSGYGDILGKFSCLNDWKLSVIVRGEYFCPYVYNLVREMLDRTRNLGERLQARDPDAVKTLMEALVGVGVAMAFVGNSRPASGSEHHLSHFFEIVGILNDEPYFMHGTDVAYSSVYTQRLRERLLAIDRPVRNAVPGREAWLRAIRRVYTDVADGVIAQQDRLGWYGEDRYPVYLERWEEIRAVLSECPSTETMVGYLRSVGLDIAQFDALYGREKIGDALRFAKDLKDRFSVLWLYYDLMVSETDV